MPPGRAAASTIYCMHELCFLTNVSGEQWAAWTQAFLSAAAIFASVLLVNRQHKLELARNALAEAERKRQHLNCAFQLVGAVYQITRKVVTWAQPSGTPLHDRYDLQKMKIELDGLVEALRQTDYGRFDEHTPIEAILYAVSTARQMIGHLSNVYGQALQVSAADIALTLQMGNDLGPPLKERLDKLHQMLAVTTPH